jgi:hypothetical protein
MSYNVFLTLNFAYLKKRCKKKGDQKINLVIIFEVLAYENNPFVTKMGVFQWLSF